MNFFVKVKELKRFWKSGICNRIADAFLSKPLCDKPFFPQ
jgi:hypothetical protein